MRVKDVFCAVSSSGTIDNVVVSVQPPLRRRLRQTQRGRNLLDCFHFNGVQFLCGKNHYLARLHVNTQDLRQTRLWCMDVVSCVWLCVGVKCAQKTCSFCHIFADERFFINRSTKMKLLTIVSGLLLHTAISRKKKPSMPKTQGE